MEKRLRKEGAAKSVRADAYAHRARARLQPEPPGTKPRPVPTALRPAG